MPVEPGAAYTMGLLVPHSADVVCVVCAPLPTGPRAYGFPEVVWEAHGGTCSAAHMSARQHVAAF